CEYIHPPTRLLLLSARQGSGRRGSSSTRIARCDTTQQCCSRQDVACGCEEEVRRQQGRQLDGHQPRSSRRGGSAEGVRVTTGTGSDSRSGREENVRSGWHTISAMSLQRWTPVRARVGYTSVSTVCL